MQWKPEYALGIDEIDAQHQALIAKFAEVEQVVAAKTGWMNVHYALVELTEVARKHFVFEEALMRLFGLPTAADHERNHAHFFMKMAEIESHSFRGTAESELIKFLYEWLRVHILVADKRDYAESILGGAQVAKSAVV